MSGLSSEQISDLYEAHGREVLVFLTRRTCDAQVALDLMSETFAQALLGRRRLRGSGEEVARAWLFGIARRRLAQYYRHGQVEQRALRRLGLDPASAPEDELRRVEELAGVEQVRDALAAALRELSAEQRDAVRLRVVDGYGYDEIDRPRCKRANSAGQGLARVARAARPGGSGTSARSGRR
jgi:RNA polymerase sigma-70 factor (ECF subfamily)